MNETIDTEINIYKKKLTSVYRDSSKLNLQVKPLCSRKDLAVRTDCISRVVHQKLVPLHVMSLQITSESHSKAFDHRFELIYNSDKIE